MSHKLIRLTKLLEEAKKTMDAVLTALQNEIESIHSDGDVDAEITAQVNAAVSPAVANAVAPFAQQITDLETTLKALADQLTNPNVTPAQVATAAQTATAAVTASQAATVTNTAAVGVPAPAAGATS